LFAREGRRVVAADIDEAGAKDTAAEITGSGGEAIAVTVDVTDVAATTAMADAALEQWGRIDIIVNNAALWGDLVASPVTEIEPEYWDQVFAVNVKGPLLCSRAVLPAMRTAGFGRVVNVSSMGAYMRGGAYATSKAALNHLTWNLAHEAGEGVTVNAVAPGGVFNEATRRQVPQAAFDALIQNCIVKRACTADDVFAAIRFLTADDAGYVTGQVVSVNGGFNTRF
jgi:NAD(P)-dependent dehydrogenase (short-subunit alcohol dehydrogenase family)